MEEQAIDASNGGDEPDSPEMSASDARERLEKGDLDFEDRSFAAAAAAAAATTAATTATTSLPPLRKRNHRCHFQYQFRYQSCRWRALLRYLVRATAPLAYLSRTDATGRLRAMPPPPAPPPRDPTRPPRRAAPRAGGRRAGRA